MPEDDKKVGKSKYKTVPLKDYVDRTSQLYDNQFGAFFPQQNFEALQKRNEDFRGQHGEFAANREYWGDIYNQNVPSEKKPLSDVILNVARKQGVNPKLLFGNAAEEGVFKALHGDQVLNYAGTPDQKYKFNGMALLGLDTFSERKDELKKYLPADFDFIESEATNNKGEVKKSALFKSPTDALTAMTAFLKSNQDEVKGAAKQKGLTLSPEANDFFTMAAYNGGIGNAQKMMDYYQSKGLLKDNKFLKEDDLANDKYGGIYQNVRRRVDAVNALEGEGKLDFSDKRIANAEKGMWTGNLTGYSKKQGDYSVITPTDKKIPFDIVTVGNTKRVVPRGTDITKLDVNSLPTLDSYDYEANVKAVSPSQQPKPVFTQLKREDEAKYSEWANRNNIKIDPKSDDYDYRGWWEENKGADVKEGVHFVDKYKKPNHITFSDESKYSDNEKKGGKWRQVGDKWEFHPSDFNLKQHSRAELESYFNKNEPNSTIVFDKKQ